MSTKKYDIIEIISAPQCRAARGLLAWTQSELAMRAAIGISTVADFERGKRIPTRNNLLSMRRVFEANGIEFINGPESRIGVAILSRC